ncbi:MAG TPA: FAD-binding oxidoreductase [Vicinamibacterales bacterium]|nr:FAD-binding oxidoreductase [Vicinamibacterales bacterium]
MKARPPSDIDAPVAEADASAFLEDAAHYPGGHAGGVVRPRSIDEVSACLRDASRVLPVGAQSSLTGGATPFGDIVLSTARLNAIAIDGDRVHADAGVPLQALQEALAKTGRWFPPVPTYLGAFAGGAIATCAAGAATFKYGTVRDWVDGLTVVLAGGDVLELWRGQCRAVDGRFTITTASGDRVVSLPDLKMPDVPKRSAGYFVAPDMDLVDLFVGSEGTLGVIVKAAFRTAPMPAGLCRAFVPVPSEALAIAITGELRDAAMATWQSKDPLGIDIAAIEHLDARSIAVIREDGIDRKLDISLPSGSAVALLVDLELSAPAAAMDLWSQLESIRGDAAPDSPLVRFCRVLDRHGVLDDTEIALPADRARAAAFADLREAVPAGVNRRVAQAKQIDPQISKTAADMIVPFDRFGDMMHECRKLFAGLDLAVWGHISDGNVHPNVIPRNAADAQRGRDAILELGNAVIAMGGCPLAEHGVGRNPIKQRLLRQLYGTAGINAMRATKLSLDPNGSLASGVIFPSQ